VAAPYNGGDGFPFHVRVCSPRLVIRPLLPALAVACAALPARAFDGAFKPIEGGAWSTDAPVEFVLDPEGSDDIDDGSDLDAVRSAFRAWECVPGHTLRFLDAGNGPAEVDLEDGLNTVYWDENDDLGMGAGTLGVTVGTISGVRNAADIAFNGRDHTWSAVDDGFATDVQSIALHEIGHFLGLDHPCDGDGNNETNCNGADRSVMTPVWSGELERGPRADDEQGIRALYPAGDDDESGCDGPFRKGEPCSCDGECVTGLVCAGVGDGPRVCADICAADDRDCGAGFACVLDPPQDGDVARGVCVRVGDEGKPPGAVCANRGECADDRACTLLFEVTSSLCQQPCEADSACDGGRCFEGFCMATAVHEACPEADPGCGCQVARPSTATPLAGVALLVLGAGALLRRRRRGAA
jgi:MYXO-CTERM domain-containing protein